MRGISPIIASVLLIAITMSVAVVLATFVTSYTSETVGRISPACMGGGIIFVSADYPRLETSSGKLTAVIESQFVDLSDFTLDIWYDNDTFASYEDENDLSLAAGATGTVLESSVANPTNVNKVRVSAGNCVNVKTGWTAPVTV